MSQLSSAIRASASKLNGSQKTATACGCYGVTEVCRKIHPKTCLQRFIIWIRMRRQMLAVRRSILCPTPLPLFTPTQELKLHLSRQWASDSGRQYLGRLFDKSVWRYSSLAIMIDVDLSTNFVLHISLEPLIFRCSWPWGSARRSWKTCWPSFGIFNWNWNSSGCSRTLTRGSVDGLMCWSVLVGNISALKNLEKVPEG